eukprot:SM000022S07137  [mRNA]  locus=s22:186934:187478:- [translate_table: standard]
MPSVRPRLQLRSRRRRRPSPHRLSLPPNQSPRLPRRPRSPGPLRPPSRHRQRRRRLRLVPRLGTPASRAQLPNQAKPLRPPSLRLLPRRLRRTSLQMPRRQRSMAPPRAPPRGRR